MPLSQFICQLMISNIFFVREISKHIKWEIWVPSRLGQAITSVAAQREGTSVTIDLSFLIGTMACCLTVTNHCINQYWLIINDIRLRAFSLQMLQTYDPLSCIGYHTHYMALGMLYVQYWTVCPRQYACGSSFVTRCWALLTDPIHIRHHHKQWKH